MRLNYQAMRLRWRIGRARRRLNDVDFFERELFLVDFLVSDGTAVDVGANKGIYSYMLARACDRVLAFEANKKLADNLRKALPANCEVFEKAVTNQSGQAQFFIPQETKGRQIDRPNVGTMEKPQGPVREINVETIRLDDVGLDDLSFLKIDVEGHEPAVMDGAWSTIEKNMPVILIEILDPSKKESKRIFDRLTDFGYRCMQLQQNSVRALDSFEKTDIGRNYIFIPVS